MNTGARMLPNVCPSEPPGEREVFNMLRDDPGAKSWTVLHSLDLAEHVRQTQGEADFVVLIPDQGILVLEIKSHHSVRVNERGWWLGNAVKPEKRTPFKQASEALHSIIKYLEPRGLATSIPMVSAVIFTGLSFNTESAEWHTWQVIDKQRLHARSISANLLNVICKAREYFATRNLNWIRKGVEAPREKMEKIATVLRPRFEILANSAARRRGLEENLLQCTEQQFTFLDMIASNDRALVSGLAGTGKTTLAMEAVRRAKLAIPSTAVGFFCFTKLLGEKLTSDCSELPSPIKVGHFHQWMAAFAGVPASSDPDFHTRTLPERVLDKLKTPGMEGGILDLLVLDEAQDLLFLESYLDILDSLLKGGLRNGRWLFFGDFERQAIFTDGELSVTSFTGRREESFEDRLLVKVIKRFLDRADNRCARFALNINCRNTQEITATLSILGRINPGYSKVLRPDTRHSPELLFYGDDAEQASAVSSAIDRFLAEGFKLKDIVLLSPYKEKAMACRLAQSSWKNRLKAYALGATTVGFTTIHAFKGLEAPVVILTDIDRLDDCLRLDLFYTGMSRALHRLVIMCHTSIKETLQKNLL